MRYRTLIILGILLVTVTAAAWPHSVHAVDFLSLAGAGSNFVLNIVLQVLSFIGDLLKMLIAKMGDLLQSVIELKLTYGGPTVYAVWKIFRDMCNMLFIVLFIIVAFSTIFDSLLKNHSFSYKNALIWVVIAAIAINFSLAIGQTIVWGGNYATQLVINLMPKNLGASVATSIGLEKVLQGQQVSALTVPPVSSIPKEKLTEIQGIAVDQWFTQAGIGIPAGTQALSTLRFCLEAGGKTGDACFQQAQRIYADAMVVSAGQVAQQNPTLSDAAKKVAKTAVRFAMSPITEVSSTLYSAAEKGGAATNPTVKINFILNAILQDFMLLVLVLSYLAVIIFMVIRIPVIWFLLAFSAIAFFTIALPNSKGFKEWFNNLLGWCIFSPLYLFIIYIGLFFLSKSGSLTASLTDAQMPFFAGTFGNILFFLMAGFIFIGGAKWAMDTSFSLSKGAGTAFGKISGALGMSGEYGAVGAVYKGLGLQSRVTGASQGLASIAERNITTPLKRREEEATARYRAAFGDRGAKETLERQRIEDQIKKNKDRGVAIGDLKKDLAGSGSKYFAAAKALLDEGELSPIEMKKYAAEANKVSGAYGRAVREAVEKKLKDRAKDKKFKDAADVIAGLDYYAPDTTKDPSSPEEQDKKKKRDAILKGLEENQPLIAAELAKQDFYINPNGTKRTAEQILEANSKGLDDGAWAKLLEKNRKGELPMSPGMEKILAERSKKLSNYLAIAGRITDANDQMTFAEISAYAEKAARKKSKKQKQNA